MIFKVLKITKGKEMKRGFSIIELVFAIVVIGLTASVLPRLIEQSQRSNESAIKQEMVYNAVAMAHRINNAYWDSAFYRNNANKDRALPKYTIAGEATRGIIRDTNSLGSNANQIARQIIPTPPTTKADFRTVSFSPGGILNVINAGNSIRIDVDDYDTDGITLSSTPNNGDFIVRTRLDIAIDYLVQNIVVAGTSATITLNPNLTSPNATSLKRARITARELGANNRVVSNNNQINLITVNIGEQAFTSGNTDNIEGKFFQSNFNI
jgi:prepilin-type cleavage/methylation N-terminal domain protein